MTVPEPLPDAAITAQIRRAISDPGSITPRRIHPQVLVTESLTEWQTRAVEETAAPALRAQGAATERARLAAIIREMWGHPTGKMIATAIERDQL